MGRRERWRMGCTRRLTSFLGPPPPLAAPGTSQAPQSYPKEVMKTIEVASQLEELPPLTIVIDRFGYGWQKDIRLEGYWWGIAQDFLANTGKLLAEGPLKIAYVPQSEDQNEGPDPSA